MIVFSIYLYITWCACTFRKSKEILMVEHGLIDLLDGVLHRIGNISCNGEQRTMKISQLTEILLK